MLIELNRYSTQHETTLGMMSIDGVFQCYTLEDTKRYQKVKGETRISSGLYRLGLRTEGGKNTDYLKRYGAGFHKGMLWLQDVPGFTFVYIHPGNKRSHTLGCILTGDSVNNNQLDDGFLGASRAAYERIYPGIAASIIESMVQGSGECQTFIRIRNLG